MLDGAALGTALVVALVWYFGKGEQSDQRLSAGRRPKTGPLTHDFHCAIRRQPPFRCRSFGVE